MPISFTQAPTAAAGESITSAQRNLLAAAFNDRFRWNLGDPLWRIWYAAYSMFRKIRNNDAGDQVSMNDEWFAYYGLSDPVQDGGEWGLPIGGDAGANVASPLMMYMFGLEQANYGGEDERDQDVSDGVVAGSSSKAALWEAGKKQRGAYDPVTTGQGAPAVDAAVSYRTVNHDVDQAYLLKWGGWLGSRASAPCVGGVHDPAPVYYFKSIKAGLSDLFYGGCSLNPGDVSGVSEGDIGYGLTFYDGTSRTLSYKEYLEVKNGPGKLGHSAGDQMDQVLIEYIARFRGSDGQRKDDGYSLKSVAADYQKFFTGQYLLAPSRGHEVAVVGGVANVVPDYPKFTLDATGALLPAGTYAAVNGTDSYQIHGPVFTWAGYYLSATGLEEREAEESSAVVVGIYDGDKLIKRVTIGPPPVVGFDDIPEPVYETGKLEYFGPPEGGVPSAPNLKLKLESALNKGAIVTMEVAELVAYKPELWDAALVLRLATTQGVDLNVTDTRGDDYTSSPAVIENYFKYGCITNTTTLPDQLLKGIIQNPVYDAARHLVMDRLRLAKRDSFLDYTVVDGNAVLRFKRHVTVNGIELDLWRGIGPSEEPIESGSLEAGVAYGVVGGSSITYHGLTVPAGSGFTGVFGVYDYVKTNGAEVVKEVNGIKNIAPRHGVSNEWFMFISLSNTGSSPDFAIDTWNDAIPGLFNRCLLDDRQAEIGFPGPNPEVNGMIEGGINPTAPSALNYTTGSDSTINWLNGSSSADRQKFFSACQVYRENYRVKAVAYPNSGEVLVTLEGLLQTGDGTYRTDDNGLTDYLAWEAGGETSLPAVLPGDFLAAAGVSAAVGPSFVPRFFFTRAIEKVYEDVPPNTVQEKTDTRAYQDHLRWMTFCLAAMCEGFVEPATVVQPVGTGVPVPAPDKCAMRPCYRFETLCFRAFGDRGMGLLPAKGVPPEGGVPSGVRPDKPKGFGPCPNTILYAEEFNRLALAVNLLVTAMVEIPLDLEVKTVTTAGRRMIGDGVDDNGPDGGPTFASGTPFPQTCTGGAVFVAGTDNARVYAEIGGPSAEYRRSDDQLDGGLATFHISDPLPVEGLGSLDFGWSPYSGSLVSHLDGNALEVELDGVFYFTGIAYVTDDDGDGAQLLQCAGGVVKQLFQGVKQASFLRMRNQDSLAALPAHVRDLLPVSGVLAARINTSEQWVVNDGPSKPTCHDLPEWEFLTEKPQLHNHDEVGCIDIPITPGFLNGADGDPYELVAYPLQPSAYWLYIGSSGDDVCHGGPYSSVSVAALNRILVTVALG